MESAETLDRHDVTASDGTGLCVYSVAADDDGASTAADEVSTVDEASAGDEAVLCLHGGMTPARALFAPVVGGETAHSWLHGIATRGRTGYALDVRGYGESEMLPEYDEPPEANDPPVTATEAARDVEAAYDFVAGRHETVHLLGVSWGTMTGGAFLETSDARPASLVQCAPVYKSPLDFEVAAAAFGLDPGLGAYIVEEYDVVRERQGGGEAFEAVWAAIQETGQAVDGENAYVAQTGAIADTKDCCAGDPPYDAGAIDVPTLVVRGSEDGTSQRADALALYDELASEEAEYVELQAGDHFLMHGPRRADLYDLTDAFQSRNSPGNGPS